MAVAKSQCNWKDPHQNSSTVLLCLWQQKSAWIKVEISLSKQITWQKVESGDGKEVIAQTIAMVQAGRHK